MRAAIYARYSSDLQSAHSIEDQVRLCRERIEQTGGTVSEVYTDAAISGASIVNRPAVRALMEDARAGQFDTLVAEALDRLSRDQEDIAAIYKRLTHYGIRILTLSEGEVSELHIGLKGTMNALFLKDLAAKVRRGQRGRLEAGKAPGGLCYGYRAAVKLDDRGNVLRGDREIIPEQAEIIRRIFTEFVAGSSARAIASGLNRDGIKSPRGGHWIASAINGSRKRKSGILYNELYVGKMVYNRQTFRKDPDTGKRIPRLNPPSEWRIADHPRLRIINDDLWHRAQGIKADYKDKPFNAAVRTKHLFSGIIKCGQCGGSYTVYSKTRLKCTTARERGPAACTNGHSVKIETVERRILSALEERLLSDEAFAHFVKTYRAERARLRAEEQAQRAGKEKELKQADARIRRIVTAIGDGTDTPAMRVEIMDLDRRATALRAEMAQSGHEARANVIELTPNLEAAYRVKVATLRETIKADTPDRPTAVAALRGLVNEVKVWAGEKRGETRLELSGSIINILGFAAGLPPDSHGNRTVQVVAAARYLLNSPLDFRIAA